MFVRAEKYEHHSLQKRKLLLQQLFDKNLFNNRLESELKKMDVEMKTLFNLRFLEEMSIKQIAEIMNCPEGTVKSRLFYLTKQLSKKLSVYKPELN